MFASIIQLSPLAWQQQQALDLKAGQRPRGHLEGIQHPGHSPDSQSPCRLHRNNESGQCAGYDAWHAETVYLPLS